MTNKLEQLKMEMEEAKGIADAVYMEFRSASTAYQDAELEYNMGESLSAFRSLTDNERNFLYNLSVNKEKAKINFDKACKIKNSYGQAGLDAKRAYETELNKNNDK